MSLVVRKAHIKRCFGRTKDSTDKIDDMYIDVLRFDELVLEYRGDDKESDARVGKSVKPKKDQDIPDRKLTIRIKWPDDGEEKELGSGGGSGRTQKIMKCVDPSQPPPETDFLQPDEYIPISIVDRCTFIEGSLETTYVFKNKNVTFGGERIPSKRNVRTIRLFHYDTTVDDELNDGHKVDYASYQVKGDPDKEQYTDSELIRSFPYKTDNKGQEITLLFKHAPIFEAIGLDLMNLGAPSQQNDNEDEIIAARMDPFQQIVNVQWKAATLFQNGAKATFPIYPSKEEYSLLTVIVDGAMSTKLIWGDKHTVDGKLTQEILQSSTLETVYNTFSLQSGTVSYTLWSDVQTDGLVFACKTYTDCAINFLDRRNEATPPAIGPPPHPYQTCVGYQFWDHHIPIPPFVPPGQESSPDFWWPLPANYPAWNPESVTGNSGDYISDPGNWIQRKFATASKEESKQVDSSWQVVATSFKSDPTTPKFSSMRNGTDTTPEIKKDNITTITAGDTAQFSTINCLADPILSKTQEPEFIGFLDGEILEGKDPETDSVATTMGNDIINSNSEALDPGTSSTAFAIVMYWPKYIDWADDANRKAVCDVNKKGVMILKKTSEITKVLGQPQLWYEGGPKKFPNNRAGGNNLVVTGDLKPFTPFPVAVNVKLDKKP